MVIPKSSFFVLLSLGLLLGGCNLFLDLAPIPSDTKSDMGPLISDAGSDSDSSTLDDADIDADFDADVPETPGPWRYVATGTYHSCGITKTGSTYCWGSNESYRLGNGQTTDSATPVLVQTPGFELKTLALSEKFSCGLDTNDELWCWGSFGTFGGPEYQTATQIISGKWKKIDASRTHACAVRQDDEMWCWGHNHDGQMVLKDGSERVDQPEPAPCETNLDEDLLDFAVGAGFTCALHPTKIDCTGLLFTTTPSTPSPSSGIVRRPNDFSASKLEAGEYHMCAIDGDGQARCLGGAPYIEQFREPALGTDFAKFQSAPKLKDVSAGNQFGCAIDTDDHLLCWGTNYRGKLGRGYETDDDAPFAPGPALSTRTYTQISADYEHACALTTAGNIECWGLGTYGRLGDGEFGFTPTPAPIISDRKFVNVELGSFHTCALQADGVVACWGRGFYKGLGNGSVDPQPDPVDVPGVDARFLAVGGFVGCAVNKNNTVACWGHDDYGLLGNGDRSDSSVPDVQDFVPTDPIAGITVGQSNACYWLALADTTLPNAYCWGSDSTLGIAGSGIEPVHLSNHYSRADIRAGYNHVCAVNFLEMAMCWGLNDYGQLGHDSRTASGRQPIQPTPPPAALRFVQAAKEFSCGVDVSNKLWCWGRGGRLGNGTSADSLTPTPSSLTLDIKDLGGQGDSMCAITMGDDLYCWGNNGFGSAGVGYFGTIPTPVLVDLPEGVIDVDGEDSSMCAVGVSGKVYCWGDQSFYRAGDHVFGMITVPTKIIAP